MRVGQRETRHLRKLTRDHLEKALDEDIALDKHYHIRSALQALMIEEEGLHDRG